jgi:hypothetical protein
MIARGAAAKGAKGRRVPAASKPMTGAEYLEELRDGREVYIYGERVKDVTTHPAFRNSARMVTFASRPCWRRWRPAISIG